MHVFNDRGEQAIHISMTLAQRYFSRAAVYFASANCGLTLSKVGGAPCRPELCSRRMWLDEARTEPCWIIMSQRWLVAGRALATRAEALVVPALAQGFAVPRGPRADLAELRATLLLRLRVLLAPFSSAGRRISSSSSSSCSRTTPRPAPFSLRVGKILGPWSGGRY